MVYTIQSLAYSKDYIYYMLLTCGMMLLFWNLLYSSIICDHVTYNRCVTLSHTI